MNRTVEQKQKDGSIYYREGYWWYRNPYTGDLEGSFTTRKLARDARKEAERKRKVEREQKAA